MTNTLSSPLHVQREVEGLAIVVRATGELDQSTAPAFRAELRAALAMATSSLPVVVDLTGVTYFGSMGLNELLAHQRLADAAGVPFRIVAAHRAVLRPVEVSGLDQVLDVHPDVERALLPRQRDRSAG
ncbi:STAS domain-containing protein [Lentzea sp. HUAS12]|uniref:STAS domain-containing protein n=1 Tax=Lentzea sp. HUAS12 TaxID=2951806 RepID=UPI0020A0F9FB|nr:STAS domain-containing protein [Lentzea sp. HUAS12]USX53753.1 STAS domain-containing protein [Lentzea sp. HUAS12]